MNIQDRLAEIMLPLFDALMNIISFGIWSAERGAEVPALKVKKQV